MAPVAVVHGASLYQQEESEERDAAISSSHARNTPKACIARAACSIKPTQPPSLIEVENRLGPQ
jgi:hypothetical protein